MYRIRLSDGRELEFPSIQEFSVAVQDGTVGEDASIFHRRAERWLPVREHPHFVQARREAPAPKPPAPAPADGVDLDAILSLLDGPAGPPAATTTPPAAVPPPAPEPEIETQPVVESVDDLPVLRTGFEPAEAVEPEPEPAPEPESEPKPDSGDPEPGVAEAPDPAETEAEVVPADPEPVPVEDLAPAEPEPVLSPLPAPTVAPEAPREAFWNRSEPALPKLELDPLGGDFGAPRPAPTTSKEERRSRWAPPKAPERPAPPPPAPVPEVVVSEEPLAEEDIPSPELVAATTPASPDPAVPDLDWPSAVSGEPFLVTGGTRRKWMPVAAAVGAVLLIVAVILFRRSGEGNVEREGLPVSSSAASATPAPTPAVRTEDTAALVTPPSVPEGRPSPAAVTPSGQADIEENPVVMPMAPIPSRAVKLDPGELPIAPVTVGTTGGMRSHADLMRFYDQQYSQAQAALEAELVRAGFSRIFGIGTLTTSDGLASGRRALAAGRAALNSYRLRQAAIEQAYQDSLHAIGQRLRLSREQSAAWAPRPSRREPASTAALADPVIDKADELLEMLQREVSRYRMQGNTLVFQDAGTAERYASLRAAIERGVAGLDQSHLTLRAVARAIGPSLPLEVVN